MVTDKFFEISKEQSRVKAAIVSSYFEAWANVMMGTQDRFQGKRGNPISYVDLFAGPGRYDDGTVSTPIMILEKAIANEKLCRRLVATFNDGDSANVHSLREAIKGLSGIDKLVHQPKTHNREVGADVAKLLSENRSFPTLFFIDPWGYKGLSLKLINASIKDWGCDCIFFFNYNRINMGLLNLTFEQHMNALFGEERAEKLRVVLQSLSADERELTILEEICQAIKASGKRYVLPFRFTSDSGKRTSHHLILVSKGLKGYTIMKEVMAKESSSTNQGVPSFEYNPATRKQPFLLQFTSPLTDLQGGLLKDLAGRTLTFKEVFEQHNVGRPFIERNYRESLLALEALGIVKTNPTINQRRKGTLAQDVRISFPSV